MPIFRRPDGDLVKDESFVRRMIPYLMRGRNEAAIYHDEVVDLTKFRPWLREYNRSHPDNPITMFHVSLFAIGKSLFARPGMNRFISGGRIYQRRGVHLSFAAKKKFDAKSPLTTIKMECFEKEPFDDFVRRLKALLGEGRSDTERTVDKEVRWALKLPGVVLRAAMALVRFVDRMNLLPGGMIKNDPMYCSAFVANLGSVGIDRTYHHLYEYGTASLFGVIGVPKKTVVVGTDGQPTVKEMVEMRWSFDERINDGFYCATALRVCTRILEDPERHLGPAKPVEAKDGAAAPQEAVS